MYTETEKYLQSLFNAVFPLITFTTDLQDNLSKINDLVEPLHKLSYARLEAEFASENIGRFLEHFRLIGDNVLTGMRWQTIFDPGINEVKKGIEGMIDGWKSIGTPRNEEERKLWRWRLNDLSILACLRLEEFQRLNSGLKYVGIAKDLSKWFSSDDNTVRAIIDYKRLPTGGDPILWRKSKMDAILFAEKVGMTLSDWNKCFLLEDGAKLHRNNKSTVQWKEYEILSVLKKYV